MTLKRGLSKHLNDEKYLPPILRMVGYFSKLMNLGCVLMNACIMKDLNDNDGQLRFIRSLCTDGEGAGDLHLAIRTAMKLFTVRRNGTSGKIHQRNHLIKDMYDTAFADSFERLPWEQLTATALTQHAMKIATNFRNTFLERPFKARLRAGVKHELSRRGLDPRTNNNESIVFKAIMENETDRLQPVMVDFVNNIRKILHTGDPNGELPAEPQAIDEFYFENEANRSRVLNMYHFILKNMDAGGMDHPGKRFTLFPICGMQSQHVIIEKEMLKKIMTETGDIRPRTPKKHFEDNINQHFNHVFNTNKLRKSGQLKRDFSCGYQIETDGVAVSFKFLRRPRVENAQRNLRDNAAAEADVAGVTWGIDPGVFNIMYAVRQKPEGGLEHRVLSRNQYYRDAGMDRAKKLTRDGEIVLRDCRRAMQDVSLKTANLDGITEYIAAYGPQFEQIWREVLRRRYAQSRFRVYLGKRRVLDKFFHSLKMPGNGRTNIAYGAATFSPQKKGWGRSVPTVSVRRACARIFPHTVGVNEYRTSKVCPRCGSQLQQVYRSRVQGEQYAKPQRGILRCASRDCAACTFINRDEVGARNILTCFMAERRGDARPGLLQRGFDEGWRSNPLPRHYLRPPRRARA